MPNHFKYRLYYQYLGDTEISTHDSDILEHLQELRLTMLETKREFYIEPYIEYIGEDGWYIDRKGFFNYIDVK